MATVNFVNADLVHLNGLTFNPGLEEILDPAGAVAFVDGTPDLFTITNNSGGQFQGFKFHIIGTGLNAAGTTGTISSVSILAPDKTLIATIAGPFGDNTMADFHAKLTNPEFGVFGALDNLFSGTDTTNGSGVADHATNFGFSGDTSMFGGGGDDILWARAAEGGYSAQGALAGQAGDDIIRLGRGDFAVHGAEQNGNGGAGEIDTLEIVTKTGVSVNSELDSVTDIDVLRFVVIDPDKPVVNETNLEVEVDSSQIGVGLLSPTLSIDGSTAASLSSNKINIHTDDDSANLTPIHLNLSGWTFTNWNQARSHVEIESNDSAVVNDVIVGTMVGDYIEAYAGDDKLSGGGGSDSLSGGLGSDTFIYAAGDATGEEYADGGYDGTGIDTVLLLGSNDFAKGSLQNIEQIVFQGAGTASFSQWSIEFDNDKPIAVVGDGKANRLAFVMQKESGYFPTIDLSDLVFPSWTAGSDVITIRGTNVKDVISGSTQNDVIGGGRGSDDLQGNEGGDAFLFDFKLGKGVDHIADFSRKEDDIIQLEKGVFDELKLGKLKKSAFDIGTEADSKKDRLIYDKHDGVLRYDDDGRGKHHAEIIAVLDDATILMHNDLFVV